MYNVYMKFSAEQFEKFEAQAGRTTPYVTFDLNARLYFSSAATKMAGISHATYKSAELLFNVKEQVIALKLLNEHIDGALPIKIPQQGGAFIIAKAFAIKYEMMSGEKLSEIYNGKYLLEKGEIEGVGEIFFINLRQKKS